MYNMFIIRYKYYKHFIRLREKGTYCLGLNTDSVYHVTLATFLFLSFSLIIYKVIKVVPTYTGVIS